MTALVRQNGLNWSEMPALPEDFWWELVLSEHYVTVQLKKGHHKTVSETSMYRWQARRDGLKKSVVKMAGELWRKHTLETGDPDMLEADLAELRSLGVKTRIEK